MLRFTLPFPPSVNSYWRHVSIKGMVRTLLSAGGRKYSISAGQAIRRQLGDRRAPITGLVAMKLVYHMPDNRRRDLDNLQKAVLDVCTHAGIWLDDVQVELLIAKRSRGIPNKRTARVEISIWEINQKEETHAGMPGNNKDKPRQGNSPEMPGLFRRKLSRG